MPTRSRRFFRGCLLVIGPIVWLLCIGAMGVVAWMFTDLSLGPPEDTKLAGAILLPLAPAILIGSAFAAGTLWLRWDQFHDISPATTEFAAASTGCLLVGFTFAYLFPFQLFSAIVADVTLVTHLIAFTALHVQSHATTHEDTAAPSND